MGHYPQLILTHPHSKYSIVCKIIGTEKIPKSLLADRWKTNVLSKVWKWSPWLFNDLQDARNQGFIAKYPDFKRLFSAVVIGNVISFRSGLTTWLSRAICYKVWYIWKLISNCNWKHSGKWCLPNYSILYTMYIVVYEHISQVYMVHHWSFPKYPQRSKYHQSQPSSQFQCNLVLCYNS